MSDIPSVSGKQLIRILERHGFISVRQSGSHVILKNEKDTRVTVPVHSNKDLGKGLLRQIMRDANLKSDDLR